VQGNVGELLRDLGMELRVSSVQKAVALLNLPHEAPASESGWRRSEIGRSRRFEKAETCPHSRSPNVTIDKPETTVTYCLPSIWNVIGALAICPPRLAFHSSVPVRASSAWK